MSGSSTGHERAGVVAQSYRLTPIVSPSSENGRGKAGKLLRAESIGHTTRDVDRDVRVPCLDAEQPERPGHVAVRRVESRERATGVDHRRERVGDLGELRPRKAAAMCSDGARVLAG